MGRRLLSGCYPFCHAQYPSPLNVPKKAISKNNKKKFLVDLDISILL